MESSNYLEQQIELCKKHSRIAEVVDLNSLIALGKNFNANIQINGFRHPGTKKLSGWYIWSGQDFDTTEFDYFKPSHVYHLLDNAEFIIQYLGLPKGSRFLINKKGYEDIWHDKDLLEI